MYFVEFLDSGREPQVAPNPRYPLGRHLDAARTGQPACKVQLPYPAPRCGAMKVTCDLCGYIVVATVAGRPDDPRSITIPCNINSANKGRSH